MKNSALVASLLMVGAVTVLSVYLIRIDSGASKAYARNEVAPKVRGTTPRDDNQGSPRQRIMESGSNIEGRVADDDVEELLYGMAGQDPNKAMKLLLRVSRGCSPEERLRLYGYYAGGLAAKDPLRALEWAEHIEDKRIASHCVMCTFSVWVQDKHSDPYDILDKLKEFQASAWGGGLLTNVINLAAASDERRALDWISNNLSGQESIYFQSLESVLRVVGKQDSQRLFELAGEYELKGGVEEALGRVVFGIASEQLSSALRVLEDWPGSEEARAEISGRVLRTFVERDPEAAMKFLESEFPQEKDKIMSGNVSGWIGRDASHFVDWLAKQDDGLKSQILGDESALIAMGRTVPEQAVDLVQQSISSEELQNSSLRPLVGEWGRNDPAKAFRWLGRQPVSMQAALVDKLVDGVRYAAPDSIVEFVEFSSLDERVKEHVLSNMR